MLSISVIIPCYNDHEHLSEAIVSVRRQSFRPAEIIVVDDGSTNGETRASLDALPEDILVLRKDNGGLSSARNFGIRHSTGDVIVTLDSDDRFHPSFFAKAVACLERNAETGVVSSYVQEFGESSKVWRAGATDDFSFLTENRIVACCAFRRRCFDDAGGYDESMRSGMEDWDFWIRVTQKGWKVHVIPERLFFYRKKASSMLVNETRPQMDALVGKLIGKHQEWFLSSLRRGIVEKELLNKRNLTLRRIAGLFVEKLTGKF